MYYTVVHMQYSMYTLLYAVYWVLYYCGKVACELYSITEFHFPFKVNIVYCICMYVCTERISHCMNTVQLTLPSKMWYTYGMGLCSTYSCAVS